MSSRYSDAEETASQRSGASGTSGTSGATSGLGQSETSSQRSDSKFLKRERASAEREEGDLLEQKRSIQDGIFSCMYTLVRQAALSGWKFAVLKVVLEGLMGFIVVFNPSITAWAIDVSNPVWQVVRWTVWRSPIVRLYGYDTYISILYVMVAAVFLAVLGLVGLTMAMRRQEQSKWLRYASVVLHIVYDVMFIMLYVSFFDYFVFAANCNFLSEGKSHVYFGTGVNCLAMPHILHMSVALITACLFFGVTALMVVASSELNPIATAYLASPVAVTRLQILTAKAAYVVVANDLQSWPKPQAVGLVVCVGLICWWNFRRLPFYRTPVNVVWCSFWFGILYVALLLAYLAFYKHCTYEHRRHVTMLVLYGIFPTVAVGWALCGMHAGWAARPAAKFRGLGPGARLAKVHKFRSVQEVELLSRVMRRFTVEGTVEEDSAALGETIIKAGMQAFPSSPFLLILYANFLLEVHKDGPAARTQLQQASRHSPSLIERYQIFCTSEASKRLKDSQECGMDLQAYIEFRRNFRAVLRVHKEVLVLQTELWALMLRTSLRVAEVDRALDAVEAGTVRAHQVYKRVLERYPTNGKLLRCYGKFLEDVKHDPLAAAKAYSEASRNGGGDAILNLDVINIQGSSTKPEFLTSMSMEDDAVIVINAEGTIMMVSQAVQKVFGYPKTELEGVNVSLLMPQPFSQRHGGYLARFAGGGEPRILDSVREVVALHKERYVFPTALCVTRMSGVGSDSIFLGVARPLPPNSLTVRAWLSPNGTFLCGDQQFASLCGVTERELVGRSLASLVVNDPDDIEHLMGRCRDATPEDFLMRSLTAKLTFRHRYLAPVPADVTFGLAGTDSQRILVLAVCRTDGKEGSLLVVDAHLRLHFASCGVSTLLGYSARRLAAMRLDQLLPPPYNTLHTKYLRDPPAAIPPTSCRAGKVVHLLNENGIPVPVRITVGNVAATDNSAMTLFVVQIEKRPPDEMMGEKQLAVTADFGGRVLSVSQPNSELFGFRSCDMLGFNLCDVVDIFQEWRDRAGESQMQLLMLALLDKEHEMPGTSWRVRVHAPTVADNNQRQMTSNDDQMSLPRVKSSRMAKAAVSVSACLQVELYEDMYNGEGGGAEGDPTQAQGGGSGGSGGEGVGPGSVAASSGVSGSRIRVTLWRRDLLTGVLELDEDLTVRRASPMTGLIVGMPPSVLIKKPLRRFLDLPADTSWSKLAEEHSRHKASAKQRSALKSTTGPRGVISPIMAFIGPHPDTGTMRIVIQGVQLLAPGGRSKVIVTMHPDTSFAGAHADLMKVLHLDGALLLTKSAGRRQQQQQQQQQQGQKQQMHVAGHQQLIHGHGEEPPPPRSRAGSADGGGAYGAAATAATPPTPPAEDAAAAEDYAGIDGGGEGGGSGVEEEEQLGDGDQGTNGDGDASESSEGERSGGRRRRRVSEDSSRDLEAEGQAHMLSRAASKSEFVSQWVRTLTRRISHSEAHPQHDPTPAKSSRPVTSVDRGSAGGAAAAGCPQQDAVGGGSAAAGATAADAGSDGCGDGSGGPPLALAPVPAVPAPERRLSLLPSIPENRAATAAAVATNTALLDAAQSRRHSSALTFTRALSSRAGGTAGGGDGGGSEIALSAEPDGWGSRPGSRDSGGLSLAAVEARGGGDGEAGAGGGGGGGEKWDKGSDAGESSTDGSQAASGITASTDAASSSASDLLVDSRRSRLLRALSRLLSGPALAAPLDRLRLHSYILLAVMAVTHVVAYVVVSILIEKQHHEIALVQRQALAMDRSQLIAVRAMMGAFCERPNVTAKVSVCANSLNFTMRKLRENVDLMEQHHQFVYLGDSSSAVVKLMPEVYDIWANQQFEYHAYMDTATPAIVTGYTGAWLLGNRYIAAAREALYWLPVIRENYRLHRTYHFLVDNGLGPLFTIYARSLDLLVDAAWKAVDQLRIALITLLVVEPLFVQCCCLAYEWVLVQKLERARLVGILAMVGLPGPVLRQLATKEAKVIDDSEDDDSSNDDEEEDRDRDRDRDREGVSGGNASSNSEKLLMATADDNDTGGVAAGAAAAATAPPPPPLSRPLRFLSVKKTSADGGAPAAASAAVGGRQDGPAAKATAVPRRVRTPPEGTGVVVLGEPAGGAPPQRPEDEVDCTGGGGGAATDQVTKPRSPRGDVSSDAAARASRGSGGNGDGGGVRLSRRSALHINGKQLIPSAANVTKFMVPFVLWNVALVAVYVVSLLELNAMQGPLASLNMASHIIYRYTRVRAIAFGLVSQDDPASRVLWREMLGRELRYFESEYDALMYGGIPITQLDSVFQHPVPPSTFASSSFANEFFRNKRCFLYDPNSCLRPGDEYYEVTHNGLDVMVRRMLAEMNLLVADADEDVAYNGTRYMYMYKVGGNDLYEGLQQAAQLFVDYSNSKYDQVATLHTILLVITMAMALLYLILVLWPHLARLRNDAARQSALLSHVPPELDVRAHVRTVFKRAVGGRRQGAAATTRGGSGGGGVRASGFGGQKPWKEQQQQQQEKQQVVSMTASSAATSV